MRRILILLSFILTLSLSAQEDTKYNILLTGASFGSPTNEWFELGCKHLDAKAINRAVPAQAIADAANMMNDNRLYTTKELEELDALVIMHVHEKNVADETQLKENYLDYSFPFDHSNYAAAYDYVIKKYITECYNLKDNKDSKYYGTRNGKPVSIVLCTHWHDARPYYNSSIRILAEKWGFPLVEFDKNIGFSNKVLHPVTKKQFSINYTENNTEKINGVEYGWHPSEGENNYIQQRMAAIFVDTMKRTLPLR